MLRVPVFSGAVLWRRARSISGVIGRYWSGFELGGRGTGLSHCWGENDCYSCLWGGEHYWDLTWGDGE